MLDNKSYAVLCLACILSGITEKHARRIVGKRFASSVLENLSKNGYIMLTNPDDLFADEVYRVTLSGRAARLENRNARSTRRIAIFAAFTATAALLLQLVQLLLSLGK